MAHSAPCAACGKETPHDLLDGKDSGRGDFDRFECPACYGPGFAPFLDRQWPEAIALAASRGVTITES